VSLRSRRENKIPICRTKDLVAEEELQEITKKLFMPRRMQNKPDYVAEEKLTREKEAKEKGLHMRYDTPANMWKEMQSIVCN